jgi:hypothetical protein
MFTGRLVPSERGGDRVRQSNKSESAEEIQVEFVVKETADEQSGGVASSINYDAESESR